MSEDKARRIRDPIHDLIVFDEKSEIDRLAWRLIDTKEFQRMRRIKQTGFSELTYPGASHTRLSHSIGVFHVARQLVKIIEEKFGEPNEARKIVSLCAAILHDVGHGPFSHVFERVLEDLKKKRKHELRSADVILGDTAVNKALRDFDQNLPKQVAKLITSEDPEDIFASIVSSQFDADRMDYLRRDRYMCGVAVGHFDYAWLLENLMAADVVKYADPARGLGDQIKWLVLHPKAKEAAESYLLARYQLYSTVYYHKTTRAAEGMLKILLGRVCRFVEGKKLKEIGLGETNSIVRFLSAVEPTLSDFLSLDDTAMWSLIRECSECGDNFLNDMATRILERRLFKAFDISARTNESSDRGETFLYRLKKEELPKLGLVDGETFFEDRPRAKGYDWYDWDAPSALKKVMVRDIERNANMDLATDSPVVNALKARTFLRVYVPSESNVADIEKLWKQ